MGRNVWAILFPLLVSLLWIVLVQLRPAFPLLANRRIAVLIAHPDDEAMFFAPSILALSRPELGNEVRIICLSTGNADGIGHIRKQELTNSAKLLGIPVQKDQFLVSVLNDTRFPDSMDVLWPESSIREALADLAGMGSDLGQNLVQFDTLITFDRDGISHHPNHRSLYYGAVAFVRSVEASGKEMSLYTLPTVGIARKYGGVIDALLTVVFKGRKATETVWNDGLNNIASSTLESLSLPPIILSINGPREYFYARDAMVRAHKSQMRWFRWGWISLSRYMFINDLHLEVLSHQLVD